MRSVSRTSPNPSGPSTTPAARYASTAPRPSFLNTGTAITAASRNTSASSSPLPCMRTSASIMHRRRGAPVSDVTLEAPKLLLKCAESDGGKTNEERMPQPGRRGTAGAGRHGHGGDPEDGTRKGGQAGPSNNKTEYRRHGKVCVSTDKTRLSP